MSKLRPASGLPVTPNDKPNTSRGAARRAGVQKTTLPRRSFTRPLSYLASQLPGGKAAFMQYARLGAEGSEKVAEMVRRWNSLSKSDRRYINLDELAQSVGLASDELVRAVARGSCQDGGVVFLLSAMTKRVNLTRKSLASALGNGPQSQKDRFAWLEAWGIFPVYLRDE
jgi:hypothetical protein